MTKADALVEAGLDCLAVARWDEAVVALREALRLEPGNVEAAHGLMRALDQGGRGEEALGVAQELIAREPEDVLARTGLSMIYQRMGRIEEAEKAGVEAKVLGWKMELRGAGEKEQGTEGSGLGLGSQHETQIPCGNDNQKDNSRFPSGMTDRGATAETGNDGSRFPSGMTDRGATAGTGNDRSRFPSGMTSKGATATDTKRAAGEEVVRWFVATTNAGKLRDFGLASGGRVRLEVLPGLGGIVAPAEDEETFEGNAGVKARYYSRFAPGEIVVADDSGLEVDGLGGAPGVRSARFAQDKEQGTGNRDQEGRDEGSGLRAQGFGVDERNNLCLLRELAGVEGVGRSARYRCCLVAARDGVVIGTASGSVEGRILEGPRGSGGFGYDPLFYVEEQGCTMAEMDGETRLGLSHRGRALRDLLARMEMRGGK